MANSATAGSQINAILNRGIGARSIYPVRVVIDTTGQDLTVATPSTNERIAVLGLLFCTNDAADVTFKSGSNELVKLELLANTPFAIPINRTPILVTNKNETLVVRSTAAIDSMLLYVCSYGDLYL